MPRYSEVNFEEEKRTVWQQQNNSNGEDGIVNKNAIKVVSARDLLLLKLHNAVNRSVFFGWKGQLNNYVWVRARAHLYASTYAAQLSLFILCVATVLWWFWSHPDWDKPTSRSKLYICVWEWESQSNECFCAWLGPTIPRTVSSSSVRFHSHKCVIAVVCFDCTLWFHAVDLLFLASTFLRSAVCSIRHFFEKRLQNCTSKWYISTDCVLVDIRTVDAACVAHSSLVHRRREHQFGHGNMWAECVLYVFLWICESNVLLGKRWNLNSWHYYLWMELN